MNRITAAVACLLTAALLAACSRHNARNTRGEPVLLSNGFDGNDVVNLIRTQRRQHGVSADLT